MNYPIPYGDKALIKRKIPNNKILLPQKQQLENQGEIVGLSNENTLNLKIGDIIAFEYAIPINLKIEDDYEFSLVPKVAILMTIPNKEV